MAGAPGTARAGAADHVPEAADYRLVYRLDVPTGAAFNTQPPRYAVDRGASVTESFDRIAYYLELQRPGEPLRWMYVSMAAFTDGAGLIGVPHAASRAFFQRRVRDLNVYTNARRIVSGTHLSGGNIEFWSTNYAPANSADVPGAEDTVYDTGDQPVATGDYGSMQVHLFGAGETLFAYNRWGASGGSPSDLGIGNNTVAAPDGVVHPDWTFRSNAAVYTTKRLEVLVRPGPTPVELMLTSPGRRSVAQRGADGGATVAVEGSLTGAAEGAEVRAVPVPGHSGQATAWQPLAVEGTRVQGTLRVTAGWYRLEARGLRDGKVVATSQVEPFGVGEVFVTAGQSNSANHGSPRLSPADDRVSARGPSGWRHADDPQPIATGSGGSPWPPLGDMIAAQHDVPVGFVSVGWGGTRVDQWLPGGTLYPRLKDALAGLGPGGARAVLWHQGESDAAAHTTGGDYAARLRAVVAASRADAGYDVAWGVARAAYLPGGSRDAEAVVRAAQQRVIDDDPLVFAGPNTDELGPEYRHDGVHFNEEGLRAHARGWAEAIEVLDLPAPAPTLTPEPEVPTLWLPRALDSWPPSQAAP